jgi:hypothetical protein
VVAGVGGRGCPVGKMNIFIVVARMTWTWAMNIFIVAPPVS